MEKTLTTQDLESLSAPFEIAEHEQREGSRGEWLTYITEYPLLKRLNAVDPTWEFRVTESRVIDNGEKPDVVEVFGELTMKGVTRASVGTYEAKTKSTWEEGKKTGTEVQPLDDNSTKAAVTDCLKRCSRLFGAGSYLLNVPRIKANNEADAQRQFATWYHQQFGGKPSAPASQPKPQRRIPEQPVWAPVPEEPVTRAERSTTEAPEETPAAAQQDVAWHPANDIGFITAGTWERFSYWLKQNEPHMGGNMGHVSNGLKAALAEAGLTTSKSISWPELYSKNIQICRAYAAIQAHYANKPLAEAS